MAKPRPIGLLLLVLALSLLACSEPAPEPTLAETLADSGQPLDQSPQSPATSRAARTGAEVVTQYCSVCHARGLYNAPKIGDAAAWQVKLAEGREHLWQVVLNGEKAMPPRGNCPDCSDDELLAAMDYLLAVAAEPSAAASPTSAPSVQPSGTQ